MTSSKEWRAYQNKVDELINLTSTLPKNLQKKAISDLKSKLKVSKNDSPLKRSRRIIQRSSTTKTPLDNPHQQPDSEAANSDSTCTSAGISLIRKDHPHTTENHHEESENPQTRTKSGHDKTSHTRSLFRPTHQGRNTSPVTTSQETTKKLSGAVLKRKRADVDQSPSPKSPVNDVSSPGHIDTSLVIKTRRQRLAEELGPEAVKPAGRFLSPLSKLLIRSPNRTKTKETHRRKHTAENSQDKLQTNSEDDVCCENSPGIFSKNSSTNHTIDDTDKSGVGGDTNMSGIGSDTDKSGVGGDTEKSGISGDTEKSGISGDTNMSDIGGDTNMSDIGGDTDMSAVGGDTNMSGIGGDTDMSGIGGDTDMSAVGGDTDMSAVRVDTDTSGVGVDTDMSAIRVDTDTSGVGVDTDTSGVGVDVILQHDPVTDSCPTQNTSDSNNVCSPDNHLSPEDQQSTTCVLVINKSPHASPQEKQETEMLEMELLKLHEVTDNLVYQAIEDEYNPDPSDTEQEEVKLEIIKAEPCTSSEDYLEEHCLASLENSLPKQTVNGLISVEGKTFIHILPKEEHRVTPDTQDNVGQPKSKSIPNSSEQKPRWNHGRGKGKSSTILDPDVMPERRRKPKSNAVNSTHVCPECDELWPTRDSLRVHLLKHKAQFKCEQCGKAFAYKHVYERHLADHEQGKMIKCPHCANHVLGKDRLEKHIRDRHEQRIGTKKKFHDCSECGQSFRAFRKLTLHQIQAHKQRVKHCEICNRYFFYTSSYDSHIKKHAEGKLTPCSVETCKFYYGSEKEKVKHMTRTHEKTAARPHMCDICSKTFTEARYLKHHLQTHKREKKYVCETCMFETYNIQLLRNHLLRKHSMTIAHVCEICNANLGSKATLQDHLKRHYGQKDFVCDVCAKGFVSSSQLVIHKKIHEQPSFVCNVCNKAFINKFKLQSHMLVHTKEKPNACPNCSYRCALKANLYKHMERVHKDFHPDKFSRYRYVQRVNKEKTVTEATEQALADPEGNTWLQIVQAVDPTSDGIQDLQEAREEEAEVITQHAEAAEALAQMQTSVTNLKTEDPEIEITSQPEISESANICMEQESSPYVLTSITLRGSEDHGEMTEDHTQELVIHEGEDLGGNIIHLEEGEEYEEQEPETMYVLQVQGEDGETIALSAEDVLSSDSNVLTVEPGTLLVDSSGNLMKIL